MDPNRATNSMESDEVDLEKLGVPNDYTNPETLRTLYWDVDLSVRDMADVLDCGSTTILTHMEKNDISRVDYHGRSFEERFWEKVDRGDDDECWIWTGATGAGYGHTTIDGEKIGAHRASLKLDGRDPGDKLALHTCDNKLCVNPEHLYIGDYEDNMEDAIERGQYEPWEGESHPNSKLTEDDVRKIRERRSNGDTLKEIADDYPVSVSAINLIDKGENWSDV